MFKRIAQNFRRSDPQTSCSKALCSTVSGSRSAAPGVHRMYYGTGTDKLVFGQSVPTKESDRPDSYEESKSMSQGNARAARRWWVDLGLNLVLIGVGCVIALLAAELAVRIFGVGSDQMLRDDPVLGVRLIESKTGVSQGACYRADVTTNGDGWRSPDVSQAKPKNVYRVLILGDSFMAGLQVQDDETFARVLEGQLNRAGLDRRVEVINFSVPSWSTDQQYLALREYGLRLQPDMVLLAFYAQNDPAENNSAIRSTTNSYPKPYFDLRGDDLVEVPFVDSTPASIRIARQLAAPLRIYPLMRDALLTVPAVHRLFYSLGIVSVVPAENKSAAPTGSTIWNWPDRWRRQIGVFQDGNAAEWNRGWAITEGLLRKVHADATGAGAAFLLMGVSSPIEVMPPSLLTGLVKGGTTDAIDVDKPSTRLAQIAGRHSLDFVSLVPGFREHIGDSVSIFDTLYLNCDGHWTAAGHRLAADLAVPEVARRIAHPGR